MVSVVTGAGAGLVNTSRELVGTDGELGQSTLGRAGERVTVNAATGNLVVQDRDEFLVGLGEDVSLTRTYNSQGAWDGDNSDNWRIGYYRRVAGLSGTLNTAGSSIKRVDADGFESTYTYNATSGRYVGTDGAGAYDTLSFDAAARMWTWSDGDSGSAERYAEASAGSGSFRLTGVLDAEGNAVKLAYDANGLIMSLATWKAGATAADESVTLAYDASKRLTQISTSYQSAPGVLVTRTLTRYEYDAAGRLALVRTDLSPEDNSVADGKSYWVRYGYDAAGRVNSITQADGTALGIQYDTAGRVQSWSDALGRVTTLSYDTADTTNLKTTVTDALGQASVLAYDAAGRLTSLSGAAAGGASLSLSYKYDTKGNLTSSTNARKVRTDFAYNDQGALIRRTNAAGNVLERSYDEANRLVAETQYTVPDADGIAGTGSASGALTTRYVWDTAARRLRFTLSPEGRVTQYQYNALGQRTSATTYAANWYTVSTNAPTLDELTAWAAGLSLADRALAQQRAYAYDLRGQLVSLSEYSGASVADGAVVLAGMSRQSYVYDAFGRLLQSIDALGNATAYAYDGLDRLTLASDAAGASTLYTYDDAGRKTTVTQANGQYSVSCYDKAGQLLSSTEYSAADQSLGTTSYAYDAAGQLRMVQDPSGMQRWMLYNPAGRKAADVDALGQVVEYAYDAAGNLVQSIGYASALSATTLALLKADNGVGHSMAELRPVADEERDRVTTRYYDKAGRLQAVQDADGYLTETFYDGASRVTGTRAYTRTTTVTRANSLDGSALAPAPYISAARPLTNAADRVTRNFYDGDGLLQATLDAEGFLTEWEYDAAGRKVAQTRYFNATPSAARSSGSLAALRPDAHVQDQRSLWLYDNQGRLTGELDAEGYLTEYGYDKTDRLTSTRRWIGTARATVSVDAAAAVQYLAAAGLTPAALRPATGGSESTTRTYTATGLLDTEKQPGGLVTKYVYDSLGRLTSTVRGYGSTDERSSATVYDGWGRVLSESDGRGSVRTHAYDAAGRRISTTDARGSTTVFYYDADGQLVYTIVKTALGGEVRESRYNAFGEAEAQIAYTNRLSVADTSVLAGGLVSTGLSAKVALLSNAARDARQLASFTRRGQIQQAIDALGNKTDYTYNAFGQLATQLSDLGDGRRLGTELRYDRRGLLLSSIADTAGLKLTSRTEYDAFGRVTARVDASGQRSTLAYLRNDGSGRKVVLTDEASGTHTNVYDAQDRVVQQIDALGNVVRVAHSASARSVTMTTAEGIVTKTEYNLHGQVWRITDGTKAVTTYAYDANGSLLSTTDALGNVTLNGYDLANNLVSSTSALVSVAGVPSDGGSAVVTQFTYDAAGRVLTRVADPSGLKLTTRYEYDGQGRQVKLTDATGTVTSYSFDAEGRVTDMVVDDSASGLKLRTTTTYDALDRVLTVTEGAGTAAARTTQYVYDVLGRRTQEIVDPAGLKLTTKYQYDASGNVVVKRDALNNATRYVYDALDRLEYTIDAVGGVTQRLYDAEGRRTGERTLLDYTLASAATLTDAQIRTALATAQATASAALTQYVYDKDGRQIYAIDAEGGVTRSEYDKAGRVVTTTRYATAQKGIWDATRVPVADAAQDDKRWSVYDAAGRVRFTIDALGGVTEKVYDRAGRVIASKQYANSITRPAVLNEASVADALATRRDSANDRAEYHVYDAAGRECFTLDALGYLRETAYDSSGRVLSIRRYANAIALPVSTTLADITKAVVAPATSPLDRIERCFYDAAGRARYRVDALGYVDETTYDAVGRTVAHTRYATAVALTSTSTIANVAAVARNVKDRTDYRVYDAAGRQRYQVDAEGYITEQQFDAAGRVTAALRHVVQTAYASAPTLAQLTATTATVDASVAVESREYDAAGQLLRSTDAMSVITSYAYDGAGRVTDKTQALGRPEATTTHYVYDAAGRVQEETRGWGSDNAATTRYAYDANGRVVVHVDARGVAEAAAPGLTAAQHAAALDRYATRYGYDAAGRRTSVTDALGGVTSTEYDAFGQAVKSTDARGAITLSNYDALGRLAQVLDAENYLVANRYDAFGNLTDTTRYAGQVQGTYAGASVAVLATGSTTPSSGAWLFVNSSKDANDHHDFDKLDRVTASRDAQKNVESTVLDAFGQSRSTTNRVGGTASFEYDRLGRLVKEVLPVTSGTAAVVNQYEYDARGNRTKSIEAVGLSEQRTTTYVYDLNDRLVRKVGMAFTAFDVATYQKSTVTPVDVTRYDALGRVIETQTNASLGTDGIASGGVRTLSYYDALGQKVAQLQADGGYTTWAYGDNGKVSAESAYATPVVLPSVAGGTPPAATALPAQDRVTHYAYDALGRVVESSRDCVIHWEQPADSDEIVLTLQGSQPETIQLGKMVYDAAGNVVQEVDARGNSRYHYYDKLGRKVLSIDQEGYATAWTYGHLGKATQETRYAKRLNVAYARQDAADVAESQRTPSSLLSDLAGAGDRTTVYTLDRLERVTASTVKSVQSEYVDATGARVQQVLDAITYYVYDGLGNITQQRTPVAAGVWNTTDFVYDKLGRQISKLAPEFLDYTSTPDKPVKVCPVTGTEYDGLSNVKRSVERGTDALSEGDDHVTIYVYNSNGDRTEVKDANGNVTKLELDALRRVARSTAVAALKDTSGVRRDVVKTFEYDALGHNTVQTDCTEGLTSVAADGTVVLGVGTGEIRKTRYNVFGEIVQKGLGDGWEEFAEYNTLGKVQKSNSGDGVTKIFLYDCNGNTTRQIRCAGAGAGAGAGDDLRAESVLVAAQSDNYLHSFSIYDKRNQLVKTVEPDISYLRDKLTMQQVFTQKLTSLYGAIKLDDADGDRYANGSISKSSYAYTQVTNTGSSTRLPTAPSATNEASVTKGTAGIALELPVLGTIRPNYKSGGVRTFDLTQTLRSQPSISITIPDDPNWPNVNYRLVDTKTSVVYATLSKGQSVNVMGSYLQPSFTIEAQLDPAPPAGQTTEPVDIQEYIRKNPNVDPDWASLDYGLAYNGSNRVFARAVGVGAFDGQEYLRINPDVAKNGMDPWLHYIRYGRWEGRGYTYSAGSWVAMANVNVEYESTTSNGYFTGSTVVDRATNSATLIIPMGNDNTQTVKAWVERSTGVYDIVSLSPLKNDRGDAVSNYFALDLSGLSIGAHLIVTEKFDSSGNRVAAEKRVVAVGSDGTTIAAPITVSGSDAWVACDKSLCFNPSAIGSRSGTLHVRVKNSTNDWKSASFVGTSVNVQALFSLEVNKNYEFLIKTDDKETAGSFYLNSNNSPYLYGDGMLQSVMRPDKKFSLNVSGRVSVDGPYTYVIDGQVGGVNFTNKALNGLEATFDVNADLAALGVSSYTNKTFGYSFLVYAVRDGGVRQLAGFAGGTVRLGSDFSSSVSTSKAYYEPKAVLRLPDGATLSGALTVSTASGDPDTIAVGDWRRTSAGSGLSIDLSQWFTNGQNQQVTITYSAGDADFKGTYWIGGDGKVTTVSFSCSRRALKIPLKIRGSTRLSVLQVGSGKNALADVDIATRVSTSGSTFVWDASDQAGLGWRRFYYESVDDANNLVGKGYGKFILSTNGSLDYSFDQPLLQPSIVSFTSPASAAKFELKLRPKGSTSDYRVYGDLALDNGMRVFDATSRRPKPTSTGEVTTNAYELVYTFWDSNGEVLRSGTGVLTVNSEGVTDTDLVPDRRPATVNLVGPLGKRDVETMRLQMHLRGSTGAYPDPVSDLSLTVPGKWSEARKLTVFSWDATKLVPTSGTVEYEYTLTMLDKHGLVVRNEVGDAIKINGVMTLGGANKEPVKMQQYITTMTVEAQIKRLQTFNAFGEIAEEFDERVLQRAKDMVKLYGGSVTSNAVTTTFAYNTMGKLVAKTDPQTHVTRENGYRYRDRPVTAYGYDLSGRLVTSTDANGNLSRQAYVGEGERVGAQWAGDNGQKTAQYDVFGNARRLTDELNAVTLQTMDALGQLVKVERTGKDGVGMTRVQDGNIGTLTDTYEYDGLGQRIGHTNAMGNTPGTALSDAQRTELRNQWTDLTYYDALGRVIETVSAQGRATAYAYTRKMAADQTILGLGGVMVGGYQRVTASPDGRRTIDNVEYFGRVTWHQDLGGRQYTYGYDAAGRLAYQNSTRNGEALQDIAYTYYANGYLRETRDNKEGTLSRYGYDNAGNRTWELYSTLGYDSKQNAVPLWVYQDATINYDELNRMSHVKDVAVDIQYEYDAVGNRRAVHAVYWDPETLGTRRQDDLWYAYDAANRFTITKGALVNASTEAATSVRGTSKADTSVKVSQGSEGVLIGYDSAGQRTSARNADGTQERYSYSADGYLEDVTIDGVLRARRCVDALGRTLRYKTFDIDGTLKTQKSSVYDRDNRLLQETSNDGTTKYFYFTEKTDDQDLASDKGAGALARTEFTPSGKATSTKTWYKYQYWDDVKQSAITMQAYDASAPGWAPGVSKMVYNVNGHLKSAVDQAAGLTTTYFTNANGQVLKRQRFQAKMNVGTQYYYYVDGRRVGDVADNKDDNTRVSYAEALAIKDKSVDRKELYKNFKPVRSTDFDQNYEPINETYPAPTSTSYTTRGGETLKSIAQALWGDAAMWYMLADANGLSGSETLVAGRVLVVPNKVTNIHNNASTFRPYNPGEAIGRLDPTLPAPPPPQSKHGCGGLGTVIMVVIAVVVTIYTAGAASALMTSGSVGAFGTTMSAGLGVLSGGAGLTAATTLGAAAIGGAVGSIASQGFAMAAGMQDSFSWKAVGQAALGSAVTAGVGATGIGTQLVGGAGNWAVAATNAAVSTGAQMALKGDWNWRSVMTSAVGAGVGAGLGDALGKGGAFQDFGSTLGSTGRRIVAGLAGSLAASAGRGTTTGVFASTLGNAIGQSVADGMQPSGVDWSQAPDESAAETARLNRYEAIAQTNAVEQSAVASMKPSPATAYDYRNGADIEDDVAGEARAFEALGSVTSEELARKLAPLYREFAAEPNIQELFAMGSRAGGGRSDRPQDAFAAKIYDKVLDQRAQLVGMEKAQAEAYETSLLAPIVQHVNELDAFIGAQGIGAVSADLLRTRQAIAAALVSKDVYFDRSISELLPSSMTRQDTLNNNGAQGSGLFGATYSDFLSGKTFVAARGTEFGVPGREGSDLATNLIQLLGGKAVQYSEAINWAGKISEQIGASNLLFTGHSLGGGLASAMANVVPGSQGITFNAAGLHANSLPSGFALNSNTNILAYYVKGELVSALQGQSSSAKAALIAFPPTSSLGAMLSAIQAGPIAVGQRISLDAVSAPDRITTRTSFGGGNPVVSYNSAEPFVGGLGDMMTLHGQNQLIFSLSRSYQQQTANYYRPEAQRWLLKP